MIKHSGHNGPCLPSFGDFHHREKSAKKQYNRSFMLLINVKGCTAAVNVSCKAAAHSYYKYIDMKTTQWTLREPFADFRLLLGRRLHFHWQPQPQLLFASFFLKGLLWYKQ